MTGLDKAGLEEVLLTLRADKTAIRMWSGSAFIAGETNAPRDRAALYSELCSIGNSLDYSVDVLTAYLAALTPAPVGEPVAWDGVGPIFDPRCHCEKCADARRQQRERSALKHGSE